MEFTLTADDLAAFAVHRAELAGEHRRLVGRVRMVRAWLYGVAAYLVIALGATIPLLLSGSLAGTLLSYAAALGVGALTGWRQWRGGVPAAERLLLARHRSKAREALANTETQRRLWLADGALHAAAGERHSRLPLSEVIALEEASGHWFIRTGDNQAHVVPKRADGVGDFINDLARQLSVRGPAAP